MKAFSKITILAAAAAFLCSCEMEYYKEELYRKEIFIVSGENNIPWGWGDWQTKERAGTKDKAGGRRHKNQLFSKGFLGMVPSYHVLPALTRGEFFVRLNRQNFSMRRAE